MAGAATPSYQQTAAGPVFTRGGQAFLRDRSGKIVTVAADDAGRLLDEDPNYLPVSAEDVASRDVEIARSTLGNRAAAFAENAAAGAADVPLIPIRAGMRAGYALGGVARDLAGKEQLTPEEAGLADPDRTTGRAAVEQGVGFLAEATGSNQQEAGTIVRQYRQDARERRDVLPGTAAAGTVAGQLPYAFAGPGAALGQAAQGAGLGVRIGAQALGGALEGAAYGESQATDDAYIEDKPLTAEKLIASMGWGSLIGGLAGGGFGALGEGFASARGRVAREAVSDDAARAFGAGRRQGTQTAAAQGGLDARIADAADSAGLNPAARREAARREAQAITSEAAATAKAVEADPTKWRAFTKDSTPQAQYLARDTVLRAASNEAAQDLTGVLDNLAPVYNELDNLQIKRGRIAERLAADNVDQTAVIGRAQQETAELRARIAAAREQTLATQTELATVGGEAGPVAPRGKGKVKTQVSGAEKALREMDSIARNHETRILQATNGADAVAEYDSLRRELARVQKTAAQSAGATGSFEGRTLMNPVSDFAQQEYLRAAQNLMDETWVGARQATAQKAVNNARVSAINGERYDLQPFVVRVGSENGANFGGREFVGNQDAIKGLFESLGPGGGGARADQFARFVESQEATLRAIRDNHAVSGGVSKQLDDALARLSKLRSSVDDATNAANKVNSAKAAIEADQIGGGILGRMVSSTALGGIQGGVPGAAKGFARGLLGGAGPTLQLQARLGTLADESKLAAWLEQKISKVSGTAGKGAAVVNQTANRIDTRVGSALDGYFDRVANVGKKSGMSAAEGEVRSRAGRIAPIATRTALQLFTGGKAPDAAYRERTEQLLAMDQNLGQGVRDRTTAALGGVAETAPRLTQHVAVTASRGVSYLLAHTPVPLRQPSVMQPSYRPIPSDLEIAEFAKRWAAVADPLTVLEDFQRGMVTYEQVDALKNVYPSLYRSIQVEALQRFQKLDQAGIPVPYQDRLQADLMLDLHGAGDPTLDPGFALKVSGMMQAAQQKNNSPKPGAKPVNVAKSYASESQAIGATLRGVSL